VRKLIIFCLFSCIFMFFHSCDYKHGDDVTISKREYNVISDRDISNDIAMAEEASVVTLTTTSWGTVAHELQIMSNRAGKSGLSKEEIQKRNRVYIKDIFDRAPPGLLNISDYKNIQKGIFKPRIKLTIRSVPTGAAVTVAKTIIGNTPIEDKPFRPGNYNFEFKLQGYKPSVREYYVVKYPEKQEFTESLKIK